MRERGYVPAKAIKHHAPHYSAIVRGGFRDGHIGLLFKPHLRTRARQEFVPVLRPERFEMLWEPPVFCGEHGRRHWHYAVSEEERERLAQTMHQVMADRGIIRLPVRLDAQTDADPILRALEGDIWEWERKGNRLVQRAPGGQVLMRYDIGIDGQQALRDQRRGSYVGLRPVTRVIALVPR